MRDRVCLPFSLTSDGDDEWASRTSPGKAASPHPPSPSLPLCYRLLGSLWVACQGGMAGRGSLVLGRVGRLGGTVGFGQGVSVLLTIGLVWFGRVAKLLIAVYEDQK